MVTAMNLGTLSLGAGVRKTVLQNGLTVLTKEVHTYPIVSSVIWYRVGSRNEELGQTGKAHFLEHMLFKGTASRPKGTLDLVTLRNGGANNAFTWLDYTAYYFTFAADRWEVALEIEADRMRNTLFDEDEFATEKKVVIEELQIGLDGPWEELEHEVWATAFRQHPYRNPTVGWIDDLVDATVDDMKAFYDLWYHPRNATLVLVGDFETEPVLGRVEELFGSIPAGPEPPRMRISEPPQRGEKRLVVRKPTPVERLSIGYHAPRVGHPDAYALQVAEAALSTGRMSRFYRRLVEGDRSVTHARASYGDHIDPGLFTIHAEPKPGHALADVERAIVEEIVKLGESGLASDELARIKRRIHADIILSNEQVLSQAVLLGEYETIAGHPDIPQAACGSRYLDEYFGQIERVTDDDVRTVVARYLRPERCTVGYLVSDGVAAVGGAGELAELEAARSVESRAEEPRAAQPRAAKPSRPGLAWRGPARNRAPRARDRNSSVPGRAARGCAAGGASSVSARPIKVDAERVVLANGLTVLLAPNEGIPAFSLNAVVKAGARYEPDDAAGLASIAGAMLQDGTERRSSHQIAETIENTGGHLSAFGGYARSGVQAVGLSEDLDLCVDLAADCLRRPAFPDDRVRFQVERRLASLKSRADQPRTRASELFDEIVFAGHPNHRPTLGYEATIGRLKREDLLAYHEAYFRPNNALLALTGRFDPAVALASIERYFGDWVPSDSLAFPAVPTLERQRAPVERYVHADKTQVNVFLGHLGIERQHPDYYTVLVMDTILGSSPGFTSRIPRVLRDEQGLAYSTYSNIAGSAGLDPGRFISYIGTSPANLGPALDGLRGEIARIVEEPVGQDELDAAKSYLTGSFVFRFQTNAQVAKYLLDAETLGLGLDFLERYPGLVENITVDDVHRAARAHIDPSVMTLVVVGPRT
jgi:zinc protease